ncbi:hypothetical protein WIX39_026260 [Variovorax sp. AB1(2024)]|uniref:hypothetical protein n=1 Tax=Variovorax sp. AB1(2024) TaxID=3132214 RepID=UPI0030A01F88
MIETIRKVLKPYRNRLTYALFFAPLVIGLWLLFGWMPIAAGAAVLIVGLVYSNALTRLNKWLEAAQ